MFETGPTNGEIILRDFRSEEMDRLLALVRRTIRISYAPVYPPEAIDFFLDWHTEAKIMRDAAEGAVLVAERAGELVATGSLHGDDIGRVFVAPEAQGQGLGRLIMAGLEERARQAGESRLRLDASLVSIPFYEKLGYRETEKTFIPVANGQRLNYLIMAKQLVP